MLLLQLLELSQGRREQFGQISKKYKVPVMILDNSTHKVLKVLDFILLSILIYWDIPSLLSMYFPCLVIVIVTRYSSN